MSLFKMATRLELFGMANGYTKYALLYITVLCTVFSEAFCYRSGSCCNHYASIEVWKVSELRSFYYSIVAFCYVLSKRNSFLL